MSNSNLTNGDILNIASGCKSILTSDIMTSIKFVHGLNRNAEKLKSLVETINTCLNDTILKEYRSEGKAIADKFRDEKGYKTAQEFEMDGDYKASMKDLSEKYSNDIKAGNDYLATHVDKEEKLDLYMIDEGLIPDLPAYLNKWICPIIRFE